MPGYTMYAVAVTTLQLLASTAVPLQAASTDNSSLYTPEAELDRVQALPGIDAVKSGLFSG